MVSGCLVGVELTNQHLSDKGLKFKAKLQQLLADSLTSKYIFDREQTDKAEFLSLNSKTERKKILKFA